MMRVFHSPGRLAAWICAGWTLLGTPPAVAVEVVASLTPLHSLTTAILGDNGRTHLLMGGGSPHGGALKPSDARALENAEMVIWVGDGLERFLTRPLASLSGKARILELGALDGLTWPSVEKHDEHDEHDDDEHDDDGHDGGHGHGGHDDHNGQDLHIWLDPRNAMVIANAIARALMDIDPANAATFARNAARLEDRIRALDAELAAALTPLAGRPYVVFHDGYRHLQERYGLGPVLALTVAPDRPLTPRALGRIRDATRSHTLRCLFTEPQFNPRALASIASDSGTRIATLDPLGWELEPGPDLYIEMMRANGRALTACLGAE